MTTESTLRAALTELVALYHMPYPTVGDEYQAFLKRRIDAYAAADSALSAHPARASQGELSDEKIWEIACAPGAENYIGETMREGMTRFARAVIAADRAARPESVDTRRLDWLDSTNAKFRMGWDVGAAPAGNVSIQSVIQLGGKLTSIREAIDAAIGNTI